MDQRLVEYFIEETNKRFEKIDVKLDELLQFKWQIIGGSVGLSILFTIVIQVISILMTK